jgi:hypothetical protein
LRPRQLSSTLLQNSSSEEDEEDYVPGSSGEEEEQDDEQSQHGNDEMSSITDGTPLLNMTINNTAAASATTSPMGWVCRDNILCPWLETKAFFEDSPCPRCLGKAEDADQADNSCTWKHSLQAQAYSHGALSDIVISCIACQYERVICPTSTVQSNIDNNSIGTRSSNKKYNVNISKFKSYPINYSIILLMQLLGGGTDSIAAMFAFLGIAPSFGGYDKWKALEDAIGEAEVAVGKEVLAENTKSVIATYQDKAKEKYLEWVDTTDGQEATHDDKVSKMEDLLNLQDGRVGIIAGMDGAWQRRAIGFGSGNSKSGHNFCVNLVTKKIVNAVVYSKQCTTCERWKSKDQPIPIHRCSKNFDGSSKSMEAEASIKHKVDLETKATGVYVHTLCTDDDSSVRANTKYSLDDVARRDYPQYHGRNKQITDWPFTESTVNGKTTRTYAKDSGHLPLQCYPIHSYITDKNHRVRCIGKFLFSKELQSKAKTTPPGKMSKEEALKLKKYAGYYLKQDINQQLPFTEFCKRAPCMYLHHFNDHSLCNIQWCKVLQSQRTDGVQPTVLAAGYMRRFRHKEVDKKLFDKLQDLYAPYLAEESLWQCYHVYDTNKNESLNRKVTALAPKDKYLSGTKSLEDRINLVLIIDSVGYLQGLKRILLKLGLHLSLVAPVVEEWSTRLDKKKRKASVWRNKPEVKRRRVQATNDAIKAWSLGDREAAKQGMIYSSGGAINIEQAIEEFVAGDERDDRGRL